LAIPILLTRRSRYQVQHPTGQQYAQYLRVVAHMHELAVAPWTDVTAVTPRCPSCGGGTAGCAQGSDGFEVSVTQAPGAPRKLPPKIHAKFVIWAAGEFQYPRNDGFPGAVEHCIHNSQIRSWAEHAKGHREMVVIGGYESGMDATVHLVNAGVDVTVLASTPFWSVRTLDPSTELAPFTAGRLRAAMDGSHPPTLLRCDPVSVLSGPCLPYDVLTVNFVVLREALRKTVCTAVTVCSAWRKIRMAATLSPLRKMG
jgi:putative flavoprotein involved in K+ transport